MFTECYLMFPKGILIFLFSKYQDDEIVYYVDKIKTRKFFEGQVQFDEQEIKQIKEFDTYCRQKNKLMNLADTQKLRMLYATKFKFDKCLEGLIAFDRWRQTSIPPKETAESLQFLQNGAVYLHGRDNRYRPIIVVDALKLSVNKNIDAILLSLTIFLEYVMKNFILPGQIENWNVIMDLGGLGLTSLPRNQLQKVMEYLSNNYRSRLHKSYIINAPSSIAVSWNITKQFLEEITVRKISIEKAGIPTGLFLHCHPSQIEEKYGGMAKNLQQYWPPKEISKQYFLPNDDPQSILITVEKYKELYKIGKLQKNIINQKLIEEDQQLAIQNNVVQKKIMQQQDEDEAGEIIGGLIQNNAYMYKQTSLKDDFEVNTESQIKRPYQVRMFAGRSFHISCKK